jgi:hypothetical protein
MGESSKLSYSSDGKTWTSVSNVSAVIPSIVEDIAYHEGLFILVGGNNMNIAYSSDGTTWNKAADGDFNKDNGYFVMCVAYGNGKFVAGSNVGSGKIGYSLTGTGGWVESASGTAIFGKNFHVLSVTCESGVFVAVGGSIGSDSEGRIAYSYDGENWIKVDGITTGLATNLAYGAGRIVAVSTGGNVIIMD